MNVAKPRILCVDDEPINLKLYDAVLLPQGYDVLHAASGARALEIIANEKVDLVLLDVMLPEMNGYEVCCRIKGDPEWAGLPVVMITSLQERRARIQGIEAGADDFISKPIDQGEVLARIRGLLRLKELNHRLGQDYERVANLATFGAESLRAFELDSFELIPRLDRLVSRIIRQSADATDRPASVLVGYHLGAGWRWLHYEAPFRELIRRELDLDAAGLLPLPPPGGANSFFADRAEFAVRGLEPFVQLLESLPRLAASMRNLYGYLSSELCVFAGNYGGEVGAHEAVVLEVLATQGLFFKRLADQVREADECLAGGVDSLLRLAAIHDVEPRLHPERVGEFSALLAAGLGQSAAFVRAIRLQARLHDVGNGFIPLEILRKEGAPDFQEWEIIRGHARFGAGIIGDHPRLAMARDIALGHHENWDGSGYPDWRRGEEIPLAARIAALADRYDSLRAARPYKPAMDHGAACAILLEGDDRSRPEHFDPAVLAAFRELAPRFAEIFARLQEPVGERRAG